MTSWVDRIKVTDELMMLLKDTEEALSCGAICDILKSEYGISAKGWRFLYENVISELNVLVTKDIVIKIKTRENKINVVLYRLKDKT